MCITHDALRYRAKDPTCGAGLAAPAHDDHVGVVVFGVAQNVFGWMADPNLRFLITTDQTQRFSFDS